MLNFFVNRTSDLSSLLVGVSVILYYYMCLFSVLFVEKYAKSGEKKDGESSGFSTTTIVLIVAACGVATFIFAAILGIYVVRHRRLQRSFLSFANSHYDTRTQSTRFEANEDLGNFVKFFKSLFTPSVGLMLGKSSLKQTLSMKGP